MLIIDAHKIHLTQILLGIYKDSLLASSLGFKGGTAAYLFYKLPRFSTDLDFDLVNPDDRQIDDVKQKITKLLKGKYQLKDVRLKRQTLFWLISYQAKAMNIKIEISIRKWPNSYNRLPFYGVNIPVLKLSDMMAHKLVAIEDRKKPANRDLFDAHYFLSLPEVTEINYELVKLRTGLEPMEFYESLLKHVEKVNRRTILQGLGEVLSESQKDWAKAKLLDDLKELIKVQMDTYK